VQIAARTITGNDFPQQDRPPIAELRHEMTKLMSGIGHRQGLCPLWHVIPRQDCRPHLTLPLLSFQPQLPSEGGVKFHQEWIAHLSGCEARIKTLWQARVSVIKLSASKSRGLKRRVGYWCQ
jgi:hypothetical protein